MRFLKTLLLTSTLLSAGALSAQADVKVVASIKPIHSLVAAVMDGVGKPGLIVEGAGSPHTYALKPSQAKELEVADVVFWVGHDLEAFLEKPLEAIAAKATKIELLDAHDLVKHKFREGGAFDAHDHESEDGHDDHGHEKKAEDDHHDHDHEKKAEDDHHDHGHEKKAEDDHHDHDHEKKAEDDHHDHDHEKKAEDDHHDHGHEKKAEDDHHDHGHEKKAEDDHHDHGHEKKAEAGHGHDEHDHGEFDPHVWLDPVNAKALVHEIEEALAKADPENAAKYEANAKTVSTKLDALVKEVSTELTPVKGKPFVVFHDAYQHFEKRFGMTAIGSITVSPEVMPGAERIKELKGKVSELNAVCVFSEPQFEPKLVTTVAEGTSAKTGVLDPLGTSIGDGPELYFTLIRNMAASFKDCLSKSG
ncbi:MAG: zinc ABC transporter substrate-binding protein [Pseudomonadota bacterium]